MANIRSHSKWDNEKEIPVSRIVYDSLHEDMHETEEQKIKGTISRLIEVLYNTKKIEIGELQYIINMIKIGI